MPRDGSGVYSKPAGTTAVPNTVVASAPYNSTVDDLVNDNNAARPITAGGTGAADAASARSGLGVPAKTDLGWTLISSQLVSTVGSVQFVANTQLYRFLRLTYAMTPTTTMPSGVALQTSIDAGVSWDTGATAYNYHGIQEKNGVLSATAPANFTHFPLNNGGISGNICCGEVVVSNFNSSGLAIFDSVATFFDLATGVHKTDRMNGYRNNGTARNGLLFASLGGTFNGNFKLEGML